MGGYGSGNRTPRRTRGLTDDRLRLDVGAFRRAGQRLDGLEDARPACLRMTAGAVVYTWCADEPLPASSVTGPPGGASVCLTGRKGDDCAPRRVPIEWRRVGYGWRPWWLCPACGRRARILYGPTPADAGAGWAGRWTCRGCAALAYRSTRQPDYLRLAYRARRAAAALGARDAWTCNNGELYDGADVLRRPTGMQRRTYARRLEAWQAARRDYRAAFAVELGRGWPPWPGMGATRRRLEAARGAILDANRAAGGRRLAR